MQSIAEQLDKNLSLHKVTIPDLWQQEAVAALRNGQDVVVHAPTGAGKTLIFELWSNQGKNRGQAIYTVPTRALANDKLAEWRARGWSVGIATGDLSENLSASVIVATLETQKNRLIQGDGPSLLVVDEYQMIGDEDRGLNYELAIALAPKQTQLLLLSGSVENPQQVVQWLRRLGRDPVLVRHETRPVPLEEVQANNLSVHVPSAIRGYWPRFVAKALSDDLGPILIFAPRRQAAEALAAELARYLPTPNPLSLSPEQKILVGEHLAKLLKSRVCYHHSGLSYAARAGVIEPLAKAGQLRVVVATMGLAAGINFSLRSVALAGDSYRRDQREQPLRPDEILQMFGRAGRRGLDETGFVLVSANQIRLLEARPAHLSRSGQVDWNALLGLMSAAADQGRDPFSEAATVQQRLFTTKPVYLGIEESLKNPVVPCGFKTDAERARHVRSRIRQMLNSRGEWEDYPKPSEAPVRDIKVQAEAITLLRTADQAQRLRTQFSETPSNIALQPAVSVPESLEKVGHGVLVVLSEDQEGRVYGRGVTVADQLKDGRVILAKWIRRLVNWNGRQAPMDMWITKIAPMVEQRLAEQKTPVIRFVTQDHRIVAQVSLADIPMFVPIDSHGVPLWRPIEREVVPRDCAICSLVPVCRQLAPAPGVAMLWRRLGLVDAAGIPTRRGRIVSFFSGANGLAVAAALEDNSYSLDELIYDLANLDAGFRFCGDESRWAGRLGYACQKIYGTQSIPGYLEMGVPPKYGSGAEQVVASIHKNPLTKHEWVTDLLGAGDIDRVVIEWRSFLRQISHTPELDWDRWRDFQILAKSILQGTESPTLTELPPLEYHQTKRVEHRLDLRRH
ncbi:MAG: box helicase domain protein [Verrucomicrobiales bacterium]|nr:box helicase domain protein [Verrucomicrobiales bacterium]